MVAVKRMSISIPSCMKKLSLSEKKEKRSGDIEKPDINPAVERSCSVRTLPPDIEYNLRLACRSILRTHQRRQSQQVPADFPGNSFDQTDADHVPRHEEPQSLHESEKVVKPSAHKRYPSQAQALRTRAHSRVDDIMGQPVQIQQETNPDGRPIPPT